MTSTFAKLLNPLEPRKRAALLDVVAVSRNLSVPFMLFGAFARDVHFFHIHGVEITRSTADVDISIQVPDWASYERFSQALKRRGFNPRSKDHPEKLVHREHGQELDLLPFGGIAEGDRIIWPADSSLWSVVGFDEAFREARELVLGKGIRILVVSIPSLVVLKLVALHDRPEVRSRRDGTDVAFVVAKYLDAGNRQRLAAGPDSNILQLCEADLDLASAMLLGLDMARLLGANSRRHTIELLAHEMHSKSKCYLVRGMIGPHYPNFRRARTVVEWMLKGMRQHEQQGSEVDGCLTPGQGRI